MKTLEHWKKSLPDLLQGYEQKVYSLPMRCNSSTFLQSFAQQKPQHEGRTVLWWKENTNADASFDSFTAVMFQIKVFWVMLPPSPG
jgi:hypothetical protein